MSDDDKRSTTIRWVVRLTLSATGLAALVVLAIGLRVFPAYAQAAAQARQLSDQVMMWGFVSATACTAITALGAAYAVSHVGAAAVGSMGERPEIAGRALIFVGLAEGIAIYGLIISIMILARLG